METKVVLDTSVLVDFIRNNESAVLLFKNLAEKYELWTTDINVFELYYGAYLSRETDSNLAAVKGIVNAMRVFSTTAESMEISAKILADLEKKGRKIEMRDVLVAGICLFNSCPIVTGNKKHFERMGVRLAE